MTELNPISHKNIFFASSTLGCEDALNKELQSVLSITGTTERGGISFNTRVDDAFKFMLNTRIASRLYLHISNFKIKRAKDITNTAIKIPWDNYLDNTLSFKVRCVVDNLTKKSKDFSNSMYLALCLKDAICDFFTNINTKRPDVNKENPDIIFLLRITNVNGSICAQVYLDLSSKPLHMRGYRKNAGVAPVKENLAAGILSLMGYDTNCNCFIDCMCGSATFPIEAALIRGDIAPSYLNCKKFIETNQLLWAIQKVPFFKESKSLQISFEKECKEITSRTKKGLDKLNNENIQIFAYDNDSKVVEEAYQNILHAQLEEAINIYKKNSLLLKPPSVSNGMIFCNPPYGERLGEIEELKHLYHELGENLKKNFKGYKAFILTGNLALKKQIALKTNKSFILFNGKIECRLLSYDLY